MKNFLLMLAGACALTANGGAQPENFFANSSFEMRAADETDWHLDKAGNTVASFGVNNADAAAGDRSACVTLGHVAEWGTQFGQSVVAGQKGKTYTFAVLAKAVQQPVKVWLQIERSAKPYDRAAASEPVTVKSAGWTELHTTFKVEKDFPQGWFAYISCTQPDCAYRADMFRLYEGDYVPYREVTSETAAVVNVHVFDTGAASATALTTDAVQQHAGWKEIAAAKNSGGDLCVANANLALVFRKQGQGAEYYFKLGEQWVLGPKLAPVAVAGERAQKIKSLRVIEAAPSKAVVEMEAATASGHAIVTRFIVRRNQALVEVQPGENLGSVALEAQSRYAVLPDIFGGDLLISAEHAPADKLRFPSERVMAQLLDGGHAILACAWRSDAQAVKLSAHGAGAERQFTSTDIQCDAEKHLGLWLTVLAATNIWHRQPIASLDPVKDLKADWKIPFRALWRADYQRTDGLIDSWKCIIKKSEKAFEGFGVSPKNKSRTVWTSTRGTFAYPVCVDGDNVCLRNTKFDGLPEAKYAPDGHVILYPFRRITGSPDNATGVFDVLTDALANTPEAALFDGLQVKRVPRDQYPATCAVTAEYEKIFADNAERAKKAELLKRLDDMDHFCIGIRSRMDEYLAWAKQTHEFCAREKTAHPQLGTLVDELDGIVGKFDGVYAKLKLDERTPAAARAISDKVRKLIESDEAKKDEKANQLGRETRTIGGSQDESIGRFRTLTRELRQRAGQRMLMATDDAAFEFAKAMRARTLEVLQCAFGHEGASTE